jgi:hypothetical protein
MQRVEGEESKGENKMVNELKLIHLNNRLNNLHFKNLKRSKLSRHGDPIGSRQKCYKCKKLKEITIEETS